MTRKDYRAIALALNKAWNSIDKDAVCTVYGFNKALDALSYALRCDNNRFDTMKFYDAVKGKKDE